MDITDDANNYSNNNTMDDYETPSLQIDSYTITTQPQDASRQIPEEGNHTQTRPDLDLSRPNQGKYPVPPMPHTLPPTDTPSPTDTHLAYPSHPPSTCPHTNLSTHQTPPHPSLLYATQSPTPMPTPTQHPHTTQ